MLDKAKLKVKRIVKRVVKNAWAFFTNDFDDQSKQISRLSQENSFLLRTCFDRDSWLAKAKDIHKGERCFLLGCGPSLSKVDLSKLRAEHTMGVNGTCVMDSLDLQYFVTVSGIWWKHHIQALKAFRCNRRFLAPYIDGISSDCPTSWLRVIELKDHHRVEDSAPWFFSTEADRYVVLGGTVVTVSLQILYHLGFSEVILLGIDHDYGLKNEEVKKGGIMVPSESLHAHFMPDYYPRGGDVAIDMVATERGYRLAYNAFKNDGRKILNASPGTKLEVFPKVDYDSLF